MARNRNRTPIAHFCTVRTLVLVCAATFALSMLNTPLVLAGPCGQQQTCCFPAGKPIPGCENVACCSAVCAADPWCCDVWWDEVCAADACEIPACNCGCFPDCNNNGTPDELEPDSDGDGTIDDCDNCPLPNPDQADCQPNGIGDVCEIDGGASDCNNNDVPDECDPDCQPNGIPDDCDIAAGAPDCNNNLVPDACEPDQDGDGVIDPCDNCALPNPEQEDCQPNGIGDVCDIDDESSADCNENDVPDECEMGKASCPDPDGDGFPACLAASLGVRETGSSGPLGSDGGSSGPIEWLDVDGEIIILDGEWRQYTWTIGQEPVSSYANGDDVLDGDAGVLEHLRLRSTGSPGPFQIYIDNVKFTSGSGDYEQYFAWDIGEEVMFQEPSFSGSTASNLLPGSSSGIIEGAASPPSVAVALFSSLLVDFQFVDDDPCRWLRLTTFNANNIPNPVVSFEKGATISMWIRGGIDTDGDGLLDEWEVNGIPYQRNDGSEGLVILDSDGDGMSDADPLRKDIFVEVDRMTGLDFPQTAIDDLVDAFADSPVGNPTPLTGINLHIVLDDPVMPFEESTVVTCPAPDSISCEFPDGIETVFVDHFGTSTELSQVAPIDRAAFQAAKAKAFRYCLLINRFVNSMDPSAGAYGGLAEAQGNDFVISFGSGESIDIAAKFMHELGHSLGLGHGGGDDLNGKPNYPSIMNYSLSYRKSWNEEFWRLDYSREKLAPLDESNLNEMVSVGQGGSGFYDDFFMPFSVMIPGSGTPCESDSSEWGQVVTRYASLRTTDPTDFDRNCAPDGTGVMVDLTAKYAAPQPGSNGLDMYEGYNDWANLQFAINSNGPAFALAPVTDEPNEATLEFIEQNFPPPPGPSPIPATSEWGLAIMGLVMLTGATLAFRRSAAA